MTTYGIPEADRTKLDLEAEPAPPVKAIAVVPEPTAVDCGLAPTPLVYLIVVPGLGVIDATYDEPTAAETTKKMGGVSIAMPVCHDFRETPPIAADVTALLGPPPTANAA